MRPLRIQLWSWNYAPEPTAMGPIAAVWARQMKELGHEIEVVSAFPHYPPSVGSQRIFPYREVLDGVPVLRLPLLIGHRTTARRVLEEATYAASAACAAALLRRPDVTVAVSPSFLALAPVGARAAIGRRPWILWLQDILPDAAVTTGLLSQSLLVAAAQAFERRAYSSAAAIVVISDAFAANLERKGVPAGKIARIHNPTTRPFLSARTFSGGPLRILAMGNIGHSQGLVEVVRAVESSDLAAAEVKLVVVGEGERAEELRRSIRSPKVEYLGLVDDTRLARELELAHVGLVSQRSDVVEFNLPSKLMSYMAAALPVLLVAARTSEVGRLVSRAEAGWILDKVEPSSLADAVRRILADLAERPTERSGNSLQFAREHFSPLEHARRFEGVLRHVLGAQQGTC